MNQFQSIRDVLSALRRRAWIIVLVTLLGCGASLYYALHLTRTFEATAVVQIEDPRVPEQLTGAPARPDSTSRQVRLIEQRLMARDNLVRIMEQHNLFADDPSLTMNERVGLMRDAARIEAIVNPGPSFAPGANAPSGLFITVRLEDPVKTADLANELMYSVIEQSRSLSSIRARDTLDFFRAEESRVLTEIDVLEARIADFKRANAGQLPAGAQDLRDQLSSLRDAQFEIDRQILTLETSTERQRADVRTGQIALLTEQKALLDRRADTIREQIASSPDVERELSGLERQLEQLQQQYGVVTRRMAEAEMGQALEERQQAGRFEVLETAIVPEYPISRSRKRTAMMGAVASVLAGIAAAFLVELLNPAIRTAAQLERSLGVQPVVAIPHVVTRHDAGRRGLGVLGLLTGLFVAAGAAVALIGDRVSWLDLAGRLIPGLTGG